MSAPLYWALRLVLPYDLAYQWWQILSTALNFVTFAVVVRWLRGPHVLALLGGYLWAFALVHVEQIKHQQMIPRFWMPLAVYYAWSFALVPSARSLNRMLACVFLQCLTCVYTGWFLTAGLGVFLPVAVALRPDGWADLKQFARGNWRAAGRVVGVWAVAMAVAFTPYLIVNWGQDRSYGDCEDLIPTPAAWVTGPSGTCWDQTLGPRATESKQSPPGFRSWVSDECYLFCGFGVYALMLAAGIHLLIARRPNRPPEFVLVAAALITAAVWGLIALTPYNGGPSLWQVFRFIPGGTSIRNVARVYVTVYLFGTLGALVWLNAVTAYLRPWIRTIVFSLIAAALIFEQTGTNQPSFDKQDFYPIVDRTAEQLRGGDAGYVIPRYTDTKGSVKVWGAADVLAMWAGLRANVPVVNGYSGRGPSRPHPRDIVATDAILRDWFAGHFRGKVAIVTPDDPVATRWILIE